MDQCSLSEVSGLQQQRVSLGLTRLQLARLSALSLRQIQQLEEGGSSAFYSESIKQLACTKVQQVLRDLPGEPERLSKLLASATRALPEIRPITQTRAQVLNFRSSVSQGRRVATG